METRNEAAMELAVESVGEKQITGNIPKMFPISQQLKYNNDLKSALVKISKGA